MSLHDNGNEKIADFFDNALKNCRSRKGYLTKGDLLRVSSMGEEFPGNLLHNVDLPEVLSYIQIDECGMINKAQFQERLGNYFKIKMKAARLAVNEEELIICPAEEMSPHDPKSSVEVDQNEIIKETKNFVEPDLIKRIMDSDERLKPKINRVMKLLLARLTSNRREIESLEKKFRENLIKHQQDLKELSEKLDARLTSISESNALSVNASEKELIEDLEMELENKRSMIEETLTKLHTIQNMIDQNQVNLNIASEELERVYSEKSQLESSIAVIESCIAESHLTIEEIQAECRMRKKLNNETSCNLGIELNLENQRIMKEINDLKEINRKLRDAADEELYNSHVENGFPLVHRPQSVHPISSVVNETIFEEVDEEDGYELDESMTNTKARRSVPSDHGKRRKSCKAILKKSVMNQESFEEISMRQLSTSASEMTPEGDSPSRGLDRMATLDSDDGDDDEEFSVTEQPKTAKLKTSLNDIFKIVVIGPMAVGKTTFIQKLRNMETDVNTTLGIDFHMIDYSYDSGKVLIQMWDTSGNKNYYLLYKNYLLKADGIIIMYSLNPEESSTKDELKNWLDYVRELFRSSEIPPIMLLGNKVEFVKDYEKMSMTNCDLEEVLGKAMDTLDIKTVLCSNLISAKLGINIQASLACFIELILDYNTANRNAAKNPMPRRPICCCCCGGS